MSSHLRFADAAVVGFSRLLLPALLRTTASALRAPCSGNDYTRGAATKLHLASAKPAGDWGAAPGLVVAKREDARQERLLYQKQPNQI